MDLYPAIDIQAGRCVRLRRGDFSDSTDFGDPAEIATTFVAQGARWLHVVDLDAARTGEFVNLAAVKEVIGAAGAVQVQVQVGGGVRDERGADTLLGAGASRVVMGTAAARDPARVAGIANRHPGRIAVGLDLRGTDVAVEGWVATSGATAAGVLATLGEAQESLGALVVTDIGRDGMLSGPDLEGLAGILGVTAIPLVASGGVSCLADLERLGRIEADGEPPRRLAGVIVGMAVHTGKLDIAEGVRACAAFG